MTNSDWRPTAPAESIRARARLLSLLRRFFDARGFVEVETPLLSRDVVVDRHLDPFSVTLYRDAATPQVGPTFYLQTSPEFLMKRLLAAGELGSIYQICKAFRAAESGGLHNPEFTMLEWYRAGDGYEQGMDLLAELFEEVIDRWNAEHSSSPIPRTPVRRVAYRALFLDATGLDPHLAPTSALVAWARNQSPPPPNLDVEDRDSWLDWIGSQFAEPSIDRETPTLVYDFPASKAALAQVALEAGAPVAQRFELYFRGLELANGYHELLDPDILRRRSKQANLERIQDAKHPLPEESRLAEAMRAGMPPCAGTALGVDRLLMALLGRATLSEVLPFPIDRA